MDFESPRYSGFSFGLTGFIRLGLQFNNLTKRGYSMSEPLHRRSIFTSIEKRLYSDWSETIKSLHAEKAKVRKNEMAIQKKIDDLHKPEAKLRKEIDRFKSELASIKKILGSNPPSQEGLDLAYTSALTEYQTAWRDIFTASPNEEIQDDWGEIITALRALKSTVDDAKYKTSLLKKRAILEKGIPLRMKKIPEMREIAEKSTPALERELKAEQYRIAPIIASINSDLNFAHESKNHCSRTVNLASMRTVGASFRQLQDTKW